MRRLSGTAGLVLSSLLLAACGNPPTTAAPAAADASALPLAAASEEGSLRKPLSGEVEVRLDPLTGFEPAAVYVTPGTDIVWINGDGANAYRVVTENGADRSTGLLRAGANAALRFGPELLRSSDGVTAAAPMRRFGYTATRDDGTQFRGSVWLVPVVEAVPGDQGIMISA